MKPGYKTTEFWLSLLAMLLGALAAAGVLPVDSVYAKAVGLAITGLAALGYQSGRAKLKSAQTLLAPRASAATEPPLTPTDP